MSSPYREIAPHRDAAGPLATFDVGGADGSFALVAAEPARRATG